VLLVNSASVVGLTYLLPVGLLVTATLPVTLTRVLRHRRVTYEAVLGALCSYVLLGLLFAFLYLAVNELRETPFFAQPGTHVQCEYLYFSFVALTTLGFGDLSPSVGLPQALTVLEPLRTHAHRGPHGAPRDGRAPIESPVSAGFLRPSCRASSRSVVDRRSLGWPEWSPRNTAA
jgi:Ion channel